MKNRSTSYLSGLDYTSLQNRASQQTEINKEEEIKTEKGGGAEKMADTSGSTMLPFMSFEFSAPGSRSVLQTSSSQRQDTAWKPSSDWSNSLHDDLTTVFQYVDCKGKLHL